MHRRSKSIPLLWERPATGQSRSSFARSSCGAMAGDSSWAGWAEASAAFTCSRAVLDSFVCLSPLIERCTLQTTSGCGHQSLQTTLSMRDPELNTCLAVVPLVIPCLVEVPSFDRMGGTGCALMVPIRQSICAQARVTSSQMSSADVGSAAAE